MTNTSSSDYAIPAGKYAAPNQVKAELKPRAVAALVSLRCEPKTRVQLRNAIGDRNVQSTLDLLGDLRELGLVGQVPGDDRWYLDHDGVGWLESNGLPVEREARLSVAQDARAKLQGSRCDHGCR